MDFFSSFQSYLDFGVVFIVLCSGFFQKYYLKSFALSKDPSYDSALKTLALSFLISSIYIFLIKDPNKGSNWAKYFISYFAATSLYEILIEPFTEFIKKISGTKQ